MISETTKTALLVEIHRAIEESVLHAVQSLGDPNADIRGMYPPNSELTAAEREALHSLHLSEPALSALFKLMRNAAGHPFFHFFSLLDGVADPPGTLNGKRVFEQVWLGLSLAPKPAGNGPMLHSEFFDSFWVYQQQVLLTLMFVLNWYQPKGPTQPAPQ